MAEVIPNPIQEGLRKLSRLADAQRSALAEPLPIDIPRSLRLGRCVEVWADPDDDASDWSSAWDRFDVARAAWLVSVGRSTELPVVVIPDAVPWLVATQPDRLKLIECSLSDVPALRSEAEDLFALEKGKRR